MANLFDNHLPRLKTELQAIVACSQPVVTGQFARKRLRSADVRPVGQPRQQFAMRDLMGLGNWPSSCAASCSSVTLGMMIV